MELLSKEKYEAERQRREELAAQNKNKLYDLYLPKAGEQIQVQFVNGTTVEQANQGLWCHFVNLVSKKGKQFQLKVPCYEANMEQDCPICNRGEHITKDFFGAEVDEHHTSYVVPFIVINLHQEWNKTQKKFVPTTDMQVVDGKNQIVEDKPELVKFLCSTKSFISDFTKFIGENGGDISNKVITIQGVYKDKDGNIIEEGTKMQKRYVFAINDMIEPVDVSTFGEIPNPSDLFANHTPEEMERYVQTGSFFEKKSKDDEDVNRNDDNSEKETTTTQPSTESESKLADVEGVTFGKRP